MSYNFENEEDVKSYLQNIYSEYKFSCEKENDAEGCHLLGEYFETLKRDRAGAAKIFKENCDKRNHGHSCLKFSTYSYLGIDCPSSYEDAFNYAKKACDANFINGCLYSGVMLTSDDKRNPTFKKDYIEGMKYLEKACDARDSKACYFASGIYIIGKEGVERNRTKAAELSQKACAYGNLYACANLSQMYKRGDGVEKNDELYQLYRKKALDLKDELKKRKTIGLQQYT